MATIFEFGPFRFDPAQQELRQRGRRVRVSVSLLKLLTLFLSRPDELVTREQIADTLWQDQGTVDVVIGINTTVRRLRDILDDDSSAPLYIATEIGLGYRFIAEVKITENTESASPPSQPGPQPDAVSVAANPAVAANPVATNIEEAAPATGSPSTRFRHLLSVGIVLAVVLLVAGVGTILIRHRRSATAPKQQASAAVPLATEISSNNGGSNNQDNKVTAADISPDGHLLAYSDHFGISLHSLENGSEQLLTSPTPFLAERISWYPDETALLVSGVDPTNQTSKAWKVFLHGTPPRLLFRDASFAAISPDGSAIAYTSADNTELWISDGQGQNSRLLTPSVAGKRIAGLLWSPGNNRLVFNRRSTTEDAGTAKPSTDTRATEATQDDYESVDAATGKLLSTRPDIRFDSGILLKDGRFLFVSNHAAGGAHLLLVNTDPETGRFLSNPQPPPPEQDWIVNGNATESLSASANGEKIAAILNRHTIDTYWANIQMPGHTLSGETLLTADLEPNFPHAWSPDGDAVVLDGNSGTGQVAIKRLGEAAPKVLTRLQKTAAMANFSPDGKWILFTEYDGVPYRAIGIFRIPAGGGEPVQLATTGAIGEFHCSLSSTGSCVVRETIEKEFVYYALDPVRGMGQELGRLNRQPTVIGDWSLSPDGATVAMANHDPDHPAIQLLPLSVHGAGRLSTIPLRGFGVVRNATWAPDAKGFYVQTKPASGFELLYVDRAGHATVLRQSPDSIWGIPSRDGKKLAFPLLTVRSNVWISTTGLGTAAR